MGWSAMSSVVVTVTTEAVLLKVESCVVVRLLSSDNIGGLNKAQFRNVTVHAPSCSGTRLAAIYSVAGRGFEPQRGQLFVLSSYLT